MTTRFGVQQEHSLHVYLMKSVTQICQDLGVTLCKELTGVDVEPTSHRPRIVATIEEKDSDPPEKRSMTRSAFHACIIDDLSVKGTCNVMVHVYGTVPLDQQATENQCQQPPASGVDGRPMLVQTVSVDASDRVSNNAKAVHSWLDSAVSTACRDGYRCVLRSLPWKERDVMEQRIDSLVKVNQTCLRLGGQVPILNGNVDMLVRPIQSVLGKTAANLVYEECCSNEGRRLTTILSVYEAVYKIVVTGKPHSQALRTLYFTTFHAPF